VPAGACQLRLVEISDGYLLTGWHEVGIVITVGGNTATEGIAVKGFFAFGTIVIVSIASMGAITQSVGDKTLTNCEVNFASNPFDNPAPSSVQTSCGYVYINSHFKNGIGNPDAITAMNKAVHSGKPLTIKATGFAGINLAYEITASE